MPQILDIRPIPPRQKHPTIFATFDALEVGAAFELVNDHDPRPLRYQFLVERPDAFDWASLVVRVGGDLLGSPALRDWGGIGNVASVLLFVGLSAVGAALGARRPGSPKLRRVAPEVPSDSPIGAARWSLSFPPPESSP